MHIRKTFRQQSIHTQKIKNSQQHRPQQLRNWLHLNLKAKADYVTEDMKKIITTAKEEIQKAKTVDDVTKLYNQAKSDYNTAYVTSMRAVMKETGCSVNR